MNKILLIDDATEFHELVKYCLTDLASISVASNEKETFEQLERDRFDMILLDVGLPGSGKNGFEICEAIQSDRRWNAIPVFFTTARADVDDKISGFHLGADDYITKPIHLEEFRARVTSRLNKSKKRAPTSIDMIERGDIAISMLEQKAYALDTDAKRDLKLTTTEFKIFSNLVLNEGNVISVSEISRLVWPEQVYSADHSIYTHIYSLRKKLQKRRSYIESAPEGYRFAPKTE